MQSLGHVQAREVPRLCSGVEEFDRVLGGGLVEGGVVLIGGDPGIGKSTLLLQSLAALSADARVLYVSGEESAAQVALRARRLGVDAAKVRSVVGDRARARHRDDREEQPAVVGDRFDPDAVHRRTARRRPDRWRRCANALRS